MRLVIILPVLQVANKLGLQLGLRPPPPPAFHTLAKDISLDRGATHFTLAKAMKSNITFLYKNVNMHTNCSLEKFKHFLFKK